MTICDNCAFAVFNDYVVIGCVEDNKQMFDDGKIVPEEYPCIDYCSIKDYQRDGEFNSNDYQK